MGEGYVESGFVFTRPDGNPMHPHFFSDCFERLAKAAGLPKIRLHDLRHSYASAVLVAGVPAKVVSERMGHAVIAITLDTYTHTLPGLDELAATTVARLILGGSEDDSGSLGDQNVTIQGDDADESEASE
ncbi:MAG: site-specific integrase [Actinomycetota bacterium]